jgi:dihydrofolate reductase
VGSLEEAIALFPKEEEIFIIGGAQIYALALEVADRLYLTRVFHSYEGDTSFPEWNQEEWKLTSKDAYPCGEKFPYPFSFETYERR